MKKNKNKKLQAQIQALNNQLAVKENKIKIKSEAIYDIAKYIKRDLIQTLILIVLSFGILFLVKYLETNLFLNKFI
jgi:hypothetical protein